MSEFKRRICLELLYVPSFILEFTVRHSKADKYELNGISYSQVSVVMNFELSSALGSLQVIH